MPGVPQPTLFDTSVELRVVTVWRPVPTRLVAACEGAYNARMDLLRVRDLMLRTAALLCAVVMLLFGLLTVRTGYRTALQWTRISGPFATFAVLWLAAGVVMLAAGLWVIFLKGRGRLPIWAGSGGAAFAGFALIAGVLTYVVPCSGPS